MKRIYIAHPLAGDGSPEWGDQRRNINRYLRFVALAQGEGHAVLSWAHHWLLHDVGLTAGDANYYLSRDESLLDVADELWVCGPPEVSAGMRREIEFASDRGIPIDARPEWLSPDFIPFDHRADPIGLSIQALVKQSHQTAKEKGWWDGPDRNVGELLMLVVTEVAEAMEEYRAGRVLTLNWKDEKSAPIGFPIELADVFIRIADMSGWYGIDLDQAVQAKLTYNKSRPFRHGGKRA